MRTVIRIIASLLFVLSYSCNTTTSKERHSTTDTSQKIVFPEPEKRSMSFDDRPKIFGDFNGDGENDTISESYISSLTGAETFKVLDSTDWEKNIDLIIKNKPICRLYSNIPGVDTFVVTKEFQQSGISYFENLGDLNNDNGDELGYVINWSDNSNLNTYYILTLTKDNKWRKLFDFPINEEVNNEVENLFSNHAIIIKDGANRIKYKFYSDTATVEEGQTILR